MITCPIDRDDFIVGSATARLLDKLGNFTGDFIPLFEKEYNCKVVKTEKEYEIYFDSNADELFFILGGSKHAE